MRTGKNCGPCASYDGTILFMRPAPSRISLTVALLACLTIIDQASAGEVRVLAAGAAKHALEQIAPEFTRSSGHTLQASYDTVGAQRERVLRAAAGAVADVVVLSTEALAQLRTAGQLPDEAPLPLGFVAVSLAVPKQAAVPDISSPDALRRSLLAATSIAYADPARGATAGSHFSQVLERLGLREQLHPRLTILPFGVEVIEGVARGSYALGVSQSSEILQHPGVTMVGPLPAPLGLSTHYAAALARDGEAARSLLLFLASDSARLHLRTSGFLPE